MEANVITHQFGFDSHPVPGLHDCLDLHDLDLRELLKGRPVLVRRAVCVLAVFATLVTLVVNTVYQIYTVNASWDMTRPMQGKDEAKNQISVR